MSSVEKKLKKEEQQETFAQERAEESVEKDTVGEAVSEKEQEGAEATLERAVQEAYEKGVADTEEKFRALEFKRRVAEELKSAKPKNLKALEALIDFDSITLSDGEIKGLSEQLEKLRAECGFLFEDEKKPKFTDSPANDAKTDISSLGYKERLRLYKEMPEIYKQLVK